jgi:hypothetical protein
MTTRKAESRRQVLAAGAVGLTLAFIWLMSVFVVQWLEFRRIAQEQREWPGVMHHRP